MDNELVPVTKFVMSDFCFIESKISYTDKVEYFKWSFLFNENIFTRSKCSTDGTVEKSYGHAFGSCKLDSDIILTMNESHGWVPHLGATRAYAEVVAERELLSENKSNRQE